MQTENRLQKILGFILNNIEDLATIIGGVILLIISQFIPELVTSEVLIVIILIVVVLLAISNLRDRYEYQKKILLMNEEISHKLEKQLFNPVLAENFFSDSEIDPKDMSKANEIMILGITLVDTISTYHHAIVTAIKNGGNVRVLCLDEKSTDCISQLIKRSWGEVKPDYYPNRIIGTREMMQIIAKNINDGTTNVKGSFSVGRIPFVPSFGIICINPKDKENGKIRIETYHHLSEHTSPKFTLFKGTDSVWFDFFVEQFDLIWNSTEKNELVKPKR